MTIKDTSLRERVVRRVERLNDADLAALETQLDELTKPSLEEIERRLTAWRGVFGLLSEPSEYAEFEVQAKRRPLFGGRSFDLETDKDH